MSDGETEVEALATTAEVAEFLRLDVSTLKAWRAAGRGPRWISVEGSVRYRWSEVESWLEANSPGVSGRGG